ncbi:MAG: GIY-YIG nuclease family protein [Patescibacteria group bacterium]|jgi:excinuclease ABC subunit C|nr:GIY-YIG nuclease family protein [bacterium]HQC49610.1 GIY-YIG nuclease family protein [bacterium]
MSLILDKKTKSDKKAKLQKIAKTAPQKPGIYFWYGKNQEIIYVGRANNLRARLGQYFQSQVEPKTKEMVSLAHDLNFLETDSLLEAIILEAKNIKKYWPKYNVKDRDDRSFIYLVIPRKEFTRPIIIRGHELKKFPAGTAKIFGPYQSYYLLQNALRLIRKIFPYGNCRAGSGRACFDYQIGLCPGACANKISARDYQKNIDNLIMLLNGQKKRLVAKLAKENPNQAKALKHLQEVTLLSREVDLKERKLSRLEAYDISHHAGKESYGAMVVFENGVAKPSAYRLFKIKEAKAGDDEGALLEVLERRFKHSEWPLPELIMIDGGSPQISFLTRSLKEQHREIPLVGISKYGGDKLVFSAKTKKTHRELAENIKLTLLKAREEAHRFANRGRKIGAKIAAK